MRHVFHLLDYVTHRLRSEKNYSETNWQEMSTLLHQWKKLYFAKFIQIFANIITVQCSI